MTTAEMFTDGEQLAYNARWLIERTDRICEALAPGFIGTWQQRTEKALEMAELMAKNVNDMHYSLIEARAAMYRIGVEVDIVMSRDMPGAKPIKDHK